MDLGDGKPEGAELGEEGAAEGGEPWEAPGRACRVRFTPGGFSKGNTVTLHHYTARGRQCRPGFGHHCDRPTGGRRG